MNPQPPPDINQKIENEIITLVTQKNYPCVAAIKSVIEKEYRIGVYRGFGRGQNTLKLAQDLFLFQQEVQSSGSIYLSFWATFPFDVCENESRFEESLWEELSLLAAASGFDSSWDPKVSSDPTTPEFCFSFNGSAFFVVGLHPQSSRLSRRFFCPSLIFNVFSQFDQLADQGQYDSMVKINRKRDIKFQGSVNPMARDFGEVWESIQFSGKNNSPDWKCPFQHLPKKDHECEK